MFSSKLKITSDASDRWQQSRGAPAVTAGFYGTDVTAKRASVSAELEHYSVSRTYIMLDGHLNIFL